jgi:hypothetical protein
MRSETPDPDRLDDWFIAGVEAADVTALRPLSLARPSLQALMTVFSGAEAAVMIPAGTGQPAGSAVVFAR